MQRDCLRACVNAQRMLLSLSPLLGLVGVCPAPISGAGWLCQPLTPSVLFPLWIFYPNPAKLSLPIAFMA